MKQQLSALALACAASAPSWSQENITMFGVVDLAARIVDNDKLGSVKSLVSGSNATSRIGFRGSEDMGGGLRAGFHLESGFNASNGVMAGTVPAPQLWDRRSTVSISSRTLGELRAGRDFVPSYVNWSRYDPFTYVGVASASNFISATPAGPIRAAFSTNANTTVRANNHLQWLLPEGLLGGLEGGVSLAPGQGGDVTAGLAKLVGVRLGYAAGAFNVSIASTRSENSLTPGSQFSDDALGGSYDAGLLKLSAAWRQFRLLDAKQTNMLVGAVLPLGQHQVRLSWTQVEREGKVGATAIANNSATQLGLGYVYNLSKRTALYATFAQINNDGAATYVVPGGAAGLANGGSSTGYEAGLRHNF